MPSWSSNLSLFCHRKSLLSTPVWRAYSNQLGKVTSKRPFRRVLCLVTTYLQNYDVFCPCSLNGFQGPNNWKFRRHCSHTLTFWRNWIAASIRNHRSCNNCPPSWLWECFLALNLDAWYSWLLVLERLRSSAQETTLDEANDRLVYAAIVHAVILCISPWLSWD